MEVRRYEVVYGIKAVDSADAIRQVLQGGGDLVSGNLDACISFNPIKATTNEPEPEPEPEVPSVEADFVNDYEEG